MQLLSFSIFRNPGFRFGIPSLLSFLMLISLKEGRETLLVYQNLLIILPYILFALIIILSQPFNQGRTSLVALLMIIAYYIVQNHLQAPLTNNTTKLIYYLLATLLPLNLLLVHKLPDKRLWSLFGGYFCLFIAIQIIWSTILIQYIEKSDLSSIWNSGLLTQLHFSPLPLLFIFWGIVIAGTSTFMILFRNYGSDQAVFIGVLFSSLTFIFFQYGLVSCSAFTLAALLHMFNLIICSHEQAFIDQLTNIPGRRALETELRNLGKTYTLAMLDIDHFKKFNDLYGHKTGDNVLTLVAQLITKVGGGAQMFRYGGEEFTILFKGKKSEQCEEHLEKLRIAIAEYNLVLRNYAERPDNDKQGCMTRKNNVIHSYIHVTVSIGIADSKPTSNPDMVLKAADDALYRAKESGRNRLSH
ncbi:GGDEF domain-containing protein [Photobacterium profundum]|uniref:diguanylate cyclase n=1 Tax=Photobacterium profundum 3TCK TaxID=314280 RepID=Q1Z0F9_9GAMM|nr:GGDEF domain-containing protein [Photobacterium profundum]EAS42013.1 hypothetical GGDEF family protein [Photobacterium profundum 3TCK]PSV61908.1 GGDEF domain-containing protein [Photobacterium profundum]